MNDYFNVAVITLVMHYIMGGLEIDAESPVLSTTQHPIPRLFVGGVHNTNI